MEFYTSDGCSYFGMDKETIIRLRAELGKETVFITKEEFNALINEAEKNK